MDRSTQGYGISSGANTRFKLRYGKRLRISLICSLALCIFLLRLTSNILPGRTNHQPPDMNIRIVDIPSTDYPARPPVPARPVLPVPSEQEDLPKDITIHPSEFDEFTLLTLPPPPVPEPVLQKPRHAFLQKPEPEGGYETLRQNIEYPPIAREAGLEGTVVIRAYIDESGQVTQTDVVEGDVRTGFAQAAITGIRRTHFKPARQFDQTIGYWDSITVRFKIRE